jgi:hypothetical protein
LFAAPQHAVAFPTTVFPEHTVAGSGGFSLYTVAITAASEDSVSPYRRRLTGALRTEHSEAGVAETLYTYALARFSPYASGEGVGSRVAACDARNTFIGRFTA